MNDDWKYAGDGCRCHMCREKDHVFYRVKESYDGGHEDYQYWCKRCGSKWWIDGVDS